LKQTKKRGLFQFYYGIQGKHGKNSSMRACGDRQNLFSSNKRAALFTERPVLIFLNFGDYYFPAVIKK
jgi:hypothetical protein